MQTRSLDANGGLITRLPNCPSPVKSPGVVAPLILSLEEFRHLGIDFVSFQENVDTSSPLGTAIFTIISAVAQLERDIIAERVRAGLRRARKNGSRIGRPRLKVSRDEIRKLRTQGLSLRKIAESVGVSKDSVANLLKNA